MENTDKINCFFLHSNQFALSPRYNEVSGVCFMNFYSFIENMIANDNSLTDKENRRNFDL